MKPKRILLEGCEGKMRFNTFTAAKKIASRAAHRRHEPRNAYHCDACGGYHIGESLEKNQRRKLRRELIDLTRRLELEGES